MNKSFLITKRDLKSTFSAPVIYLLAALLLFVSGWIFFNLLVNFVGNAEVSSEANHNLVFKEMVIQRFFFNLNMLFVFLCPLVAMNSISEERKNGQFDLILSSPISLWSIVLGKYLSIIVQTLFLLFLTLLFPIALWFAGVKDINAFVLGYSSLSLNAFVYLAVGILCSSLTYSGILAAVFSIVFILGNYLLAWAGQLSDNQIVSEIFLFLSIAPHYERLLKGIFSLETAYFYLSATLIYLLMTKKIMESKRW